MTAAINDMMARAVVSKTMDMIWAVKVKAASVFIEDRPQIDTRIDGVKSRLSKYPTIKKQNRNRAENNKNFSLIQSSSI